jgi:uncharacterized membrane protein YhaH (DUF805 family)
MTMNWMILPYQRYFDFSGRSRRMEYWMFTLLQTIIVVALAVVVFSLGRPADPEEAASSFYGVFALYLLINVIPGLSVQVRRFHDQDLSGWMVLLGFIPYIGGIIVLIFMMIAGTKGPNKYGDDPKGGINPEVFS